MARARQKQQLNTFLLLVIDYEQFNRFQPPSLLLWVISCK